MPLLIYIIVVSAALMCGILIAPNLIDPAESAGSVRFGMPAVHVPTTSAEMTASARKGANEIELASAERNKGVATQSIISAPSGTIEKAIPAKAAKLGRQSSERQTAAHKAGSGKRALAFIPQFNERYLRHGNLESF
jgi:hypothetical protein